jgi:hypothetical protein
MIIGNNYSWTCAGTAGGNSPVCIAYMSPSCDTVNIGACIIGTVGSDNSASCGTRIWTCGNAGQAINCQKPLVTCSTPNSIT